MTQPVLEMTAFPTDRFLCEAVNNFVSEVGKAYEKMSENTEEADTMSKKVLTASCARWSRTFDCVSAMPCPE